jgi:acetolactate synthase I/II/III large subunit
MTLTRGTLRMDSSFSRRCLLQTAAITGAVAAMTSRASSGPILDKLKQKPGWVMGTLTGAQAVVATLLSEGVECVFGIPGAQENELWDEFKQNHLPYLLATHEYAASVEADGYARATGKPGVLCVVPGPGITNALTGLGEAKLDSIPIVAIIGDIACGEKYRPFQVHSLNTVELLKPVCKTVFPLTDVRQIAPAIRRAFQLSQCGEPGPVAVVIPFNLFIEVADFRCPPNAPLPLPYDEASARKAIAMLADKSQRVGIYAGLGCMSFAQQLCQVAELLQSPVATSVSGKGVIPENHPLAVGWGYGPHASEVAEAVFQRDPLHPLRSGVDTLLAIGVKFSEVSTGFYGNPRIRRVIHVDAQPENLGQAVSTDLCVNADAGLFLNALLGCADQLRRPADTWLQEQIKQSKAKVVREVCQVKPGTGGHHPLSLIMALRKQLPTDALCFVDVTVSEHLAAEHFTTYLPRTYFNPVDNQSMGWSIPASIGGQRAFPNRCVVSITGDGCLLMAIQEISTAAREGLPVKWFILDDHAYHYMQLLQQAAYKRTTATKLAKLDYRALAQGFGVGFLDIAAGCNLDAAITEALHYAGPVLVRVAIDYADVKIRWLEAVQKRFTKDLSAGQKLRFASRVVNRSFKPQAND